MSVGSHADDIEIHAGGTLLKYHAAGYRIVYVMSTNNFSGGWSKRLPDGTFKAENPVPEVIMARRKLEAERAAAVLGTKPVHLDHPQRHYTLPDGSRAELRYGCPPAPLVEGCVPSILTAPEDTESVRILRNLIEDHSPECVLTHGPVQMNPEHAATCRLTTLAWLAAKRSCPETGLLYWDEGHVVFGKSNCKWDTFTDISDWLDKKMELVAVHETQMPRALAPDFGHRTWNLLKGAVCGRRACEVFTVNTLGGAGELSRELRSHLGSYSLEEYPTWDSQTAALTMRRFDGANNGLIFSDGAVSMTKRLEKL
jgi:LmbE family N-acetylglucosaminyl deacetylase